jgi:hypothetical protein
METEILLFYKYVGVKDPEALAERERSVCSVLGLTGRIIVAGEGINGTLEADCDGEVVGANLYKVKAAEEILGKYMDLSRESYGIFLMPGLGDKGQGGDTKELLEKMSEQYRINPRRLLLCMSRGLMFAENRVEYARELKKLCLPYIEVLDEKLLELSRRWNR